VGLRPHVDSFSTWGLTVIDAQQGLRLEAVVPDAGASRGSSNVMASFLTINCFGLRFFFFMTLSCPVWPGGHR